MKIEKIDSEISKLKEKITILESCIEILYHDIHISGDTTEELMSQLNKIEEINERYHKLGIYG